MQLLLTAPESASSMTWIMVLYIIGIVGFMYFVMVRPQKKEQKRLTLMLSELAIADDAAFAQLVETAKKALAN